MSREIMRFGLKMESSPKIKGAPQSAALGFPVKLKDLG